MLLLVAIRTCGSGCLSERTSFKHEKTSRGVAAPEAPREEGMGKDVCAFFQIPAWVIVPCHPCRL